MCSWVAVELPAIPASTDHRTVVSHDHRANRHVARGCGGSRFIQRYLKGESRRLGSLDEAIRFVQEQHDPPRMLHEIPFAYITPTPA